jgi:hypothetical protein
MGSISLMSPEEVAALADGDLDEALVEMERARRLVESAIVDVCWMRPIVVGGTWPMATCRCGVGAGADELLQSRDDAPAADDAGAARPRVVARCVAGR